MQRYDAHKGVYEQMPPPKFIDPIGNIESMEAKTPKEEEEKRQALEQVNMIMGH